jgi:hypothetical protein
MKFLRRLLCKLLGHKYYLENEYNLESNIDSYRSLHRLYLCKRCYKDNHQMLSSDKAIWEKVIDEKLVWTKVNEL